MNPLDDYSDLIASVRASRKYRDLALPEDMLAELIRAEAPLARNKAELAKAFRKKLHNIIAPYLEETDYAVEVEKARQLYADLPDPQNVRAWATHVMQAHASTRERLPYIEEFATLLKKRTQGATIILDLACALDPLLLPWLDLPLSTRFLAYDIHKPRIDFLNTWFGLAYPQASAIQQDILLNTPQEPADCAFFFKEAHRFEKREPGCNRAFFERLNVQLLIVSLPANDLSGHHSLAEFHTNLVKSAVEGHAWQMACEQVGNELVFLIDKRPEG